MPLAVRRSWSSAAKIPLREDQRGARVPRTLWTPKETPAEIRETIDAAEKHGLLVEPTKSGNRRLLYISKKRCHVVRAKSVTFALAGSMQTYVPLNVPRSKWCEFLIFFVPNPPASTEDFYVVPRAKLSRRLMLSSTSRWLHTYANAWHLLGAQQRRGKSACEPAQ